jgi:hypothetical protein
LLVLRVSKERMVHMSKLLPRRITHTFRLVLAILPAALVLLLVAAVPALAAGAPTVGSCGGRGECGVAEVGATSVVLDPRIEANGYVTAYRLVYATAESGPWAPVPGGSGSISVAEGEKTLHVELTGLRPETTYYVRVVAQNVAGSTEQTPITFRTTGPSVTSPPTIAGVSVSGITEHDATLEAQINPNGLETTYEFHMTSFACQSEGKFGACDAINDWVFPSASIPAGFGDQTVGLDLNSAGVTLEPDIWYEYSVVASNSAGQAPADGQWERIQQRFKTLAPPPVVESQSASNLSERGATLEAEITPESGMELTYSVEYGTTTSYGTSAPTPPATIRWDTCDLLECKSIDTTPKRVSINLIELEPGATYDYRIVATNEQGTAYGDNETFTAHPSLANPLGEEKPPSSGGAETPSPASANGPSGTSSTSLGSGGSSSAPGMSPHVSPLVKTVEPKVLTNSQKQEKALKACVRKPKRQRSKCERQVRSKYSRTAKETGKQR